MKNDKIIYQLTEEDLQRVANEELKRNLSPGEIDKIKWVIAEKINLYKAVAEAINEKISLEIHAEQ